MQKKIPEKAPISRRELNKRLTQEAIFEAAMALFKAQGYEATTIEEIAAASGVSKGTFFNYFPSKDAILAYLSVRHLSVLLEEADALLAGVRSTREAVKLLFGTLVERFTAESRDIQASIALTQQRYGKPLEPHASEVELARLLMTWLGKGIATGELRADLDPVDGFRLVLALYYGTMVVWGQDEGADLKRAVVANLDRLFEGLERSR